LAVVVTLIRPLAPPVADHAEKLPDSKPSEKMALEDAAVGVGVGVGVGFGVLVAVGLGAAVGVGVAGQFETTSSHLSP
jgi:hypothetical protein